MRGAVTGPGLNAGSEGPFGTDRPGGRRRTRLSRGSPDSRLSATWTVAPRARDETAGEVALTDHVLLKPRCESVGLHRAGLALHDLPVAQENETRD